MLVRVGEAMARCVEATPRIRERGMGENIGESGEEDEGEAGGFCDKCCASS